MERFDYSKENYVGLERGQSGIQITVVSEMVGLGVVSTRAHTRGSVVEAFRGVVSPFIEQHSLQVTPHQHIVDREFIGYLSHSCNPNCVLDMQRFRLLALRDIPSDTVLTIDYAVTEDELFKQFPCSCGAPNCRGWVTGRSEPVNQDGRRYLRQIEDAA